MQFRRSDSGFAPEGLWNVATGGAQPAARRAKRNPWSTFEKPVVAPRGAKEQARYELLRPFYEEGRSVKGDVTISLIVMLSVNANRERLAGGPGDGNECPWSAHGGAERLHGRGIFSTRLSVV